MTAKEMFEELDYLQSSEDFEEELVYNQNLSHTDSYYRYISFDKVNKTIEFDDNATEPFYLSYEELKAINKQIEELGWNNEQRR